MDVTWLSRGRIAILITAIIVAVITYSVSVRPVARAAAPNSVIEAFGDLTFVGTATFSAENGVSHHGTEKVKLPTDELPARGTAYVFHTPRSKEKLTHEDIMSRLKVYGATSVKLKSVTYLASGGPFYEIEFEYDDLHATIFNITDTSIPHRLIHDWHKEDLVILYDK